VATQFYEKEHLEMNKLNRRILFLFSVIALLAMSTSVVFAKELGLLIISGPGIKGELSLNDHEAMLDLEQSGFFDQAVLTKMPKGLGEGYNITAHLNLDGKLVPFVQMVYYPTNEGQSSYMHYTGRLEGETMQPIDEWHILSRSADTALRDLMTANNIVVQSALITTAAEVAPVKESVAVPAVEPAAAPAASPAPIQAAYLIPALVVGILALMGAALALRRRTINNPTA
jgi:hypothetical protein